MFFVGATAAIHCRQLQLSMSGCTVFWSQHTCLLGTQYCACQCTDPVFLLLLTQIGFSDALSVSGTATLLGSRSTSQWLLLKSSRMLSHLTVWCAIAVQEIPSTVHEVMGGEHGEADGSESGDTDEEDEDADEEDAGYSEEDGEADGEGAEADEGSGGDEEEADSSGEEESGDGGKRTDDSSGGPDEVVPNSPDQSRQSRVLYSPTPSRRRLKPASPGQASLHLHIFFFSLMAHMQDGTHAGPALLCKTASQHAVACCGASMT